MSESMIAKSNSAHQRLREMADVVSKKPGSEMLSLAQWTVAAQKLRLTNREKEVCKELFDGHTRNEIADHLGIKARTVRHYMEHIHQKLAVSNRVGVVLRIIQIRDQIEGEDDTGTPVYSDRPSPTQPAAVRMPLNQSDR